MKNSSEASSEDEKKAYFIGKKLFWISIATFLGFAIAGAIFVILPSYGQTPDFLH